MADENTEPTEQQPAQGCGSTVVLTVDAEVIPGGREE